MITWTIFLLLSSSLAHATTCDEQLSPTGIFRATLVHNSGLNLVDFVQAAYKNMQAMAPVTETPLEDLKQILQTKVEDLIAIDQMAMQLQMNESESTDPIAKGNAPHVQEVRGTIVHYQDSIRKVALNVNPKWTKAQLRHILIFMNADAANHDDGKTFPNEVILKVAQKAAEVGASPFIVGRIALHEISSAAYIEYLGETMNLDPKTTGLLIRNILGHNDGSGLPNIWWNSVGHRTDIVGPYPLPDTLPSKILTLADRGGQATLGPTGGAQKISTQRLASEPWGYEHLRQSLLLNAENTMSQMREVIKSIGYGIENTEMATELLQKQEQAIFVFKAIHWESDMIHGTLAGQSFSNQQEFFAIVNSSEAKIANGDLPKDYWSRLLTQFPSK